MPTALESDFFCSAPYKAARTAQGVILKKAAKLQEDCTAGSVVVGTVAERNRIVRLKILHRPRRLQNSLSDETQERKQILRKGRGATQKPQRDSVLLGGAAVAIAVDVGCCPAGQSGYGWKI